MINKSRTRIYHFFVALISAAAFFAIVHFLPSLRTASNQEIVLKCAVEIFGSVALLFGLIRFGGQPAARFGVRQFGLASLGWGLVAFIASAAVSALSLAAFARFGIVQDKAILQSLASRPIPIILLIAAMASIAEEIVFRAVLISQLELATRMVWLAGAISLALFALAHAGGWGPWQMVFAAVPGLVLTVFFIWKRDLWICMVAHLLTDVLGLLSAAAAVGKQS